VGCVVTQPCSSDSKQHDIDNETWPSAAAADNGDDDVTICRWLVVHFCAHFQQYQTLRLCALDLLFSVVIVPE